jgi:hypothetical protein
LHVSVHQLLHHLLEILLLLKNLLREGLHLVKPFPSLVRCLPSSIYISLGHSCPFLGSCPTLAPIPGSGLPEPWVEMLPNWDITISRTRNEGV